MNKKLLLTILLIFTKSTMLAMENDANTLLIQCGNYMQSVPKETEIILPNNRNKAYKPPVKTVLPFTFKNPEQTIHTSLVIEGSCGCYFTSILWKKGSSLSFFITL